MRASILLLLAGAALTGCVPEAKIAAAPASEADMPFTFAAPGLADARVTYGRATEQRQGVEIRSTLQQGRSTVAVVRHLLARGGMIGFVERPKADYIAALVPKGWQPVMGEDGRIGPAAEPTYIQTFRIPEQGLSCTGLKRYRDQMRGYDNSIDVFYKELVELIYCAGREAPLSLSEAGSIAGGLSFR